MPRVPQQGNPAPFFYQQGPVGCLLLHGFTGSPAEMRPLGQYLAERDVTVFAPLLPGFGTIPEDLHGVHWPDWVAAAEAGLLHLRRHCAPLLLCGLSMGGALALYLAAQHGRTPDAAFPLAGVAALAPAIRPRDRRFEWLPLLRFFRTWSEPSMGPGDLADPQNRALGWHYRRYPIEAAVQVRGLVHATRRSLHWIDLPTLIVQTPNDSSLEPEGARWAYQQIPAADKALVWLKRSGHNVLIDVEREEVFAQVHRLIVRAVEAAAA